MMTPPRLVLIAALLGLGACTAPQEPLLEAPIALEPDLSVVVSETAPKRGDTDCKVVATAIGDGIGGTGCPAVE